VSDRPVIGGKQRHFMTRDRYLMHYIEMILLNALASANATPSGSSATRTAPNHSALRFDANGVIDRGSNALLATEVSLDRLN
jgi:hypothetical protein